ncbi:hypothetical protein HDU76_009345 [Blyttiomyces sp. JEL0837]|nr:hypothetical protein HDU76_009345 [Blyttiomyces sp. JEL0837]
MHNLTELGLQLNIPFLYNTEPGSDEFDDKFDVEFDAEFDMTADLSTVFPSLLTLVIIVKKANGAGLSDNDRDVMGTCDFLPEVLKGLEAATRLRRLQFEFPDKETHETFFSLLDGDTSDDGLNSRLKVQSYQG